MAGSVTFILKKPWDKSPGGKKILGKKETPIFLVYWYDQLRIKISTGEKIIPKYWDQSNHKAKETQRFPEGKNLNRRLKNHKENILAAAGEHINANKTLFSERLRSEFIEVIRPKPQVEPEKITFFGKIEEYIKTTNKAPRTKLSSLPGTSISSLKREPNWYRSALN